MLTVVVILGGCRDEDNVQAPDFYTPVVLLATEVTGTVWVQQDLDSESFSFVLNEENFDGASDGHKFFVGRSGATSTLLDVTLLVSRNGGTPAEVATFQAADLPANVSITPNQVASALGISLSDLAGGDGLTISYEYNIDANNSGTILELGTPGNDYCGGTTNEGEFCTLNVSIICSPVIADPPGDYQINFFDSYGDGWNGAAIRVIADGVATDYTLDSGSDGSTIVTVPDGVSTLTFEFVSGDWDSEVTFTLISPKGNVISSGGPSPAVGELLLDLCLE